MDTPDSLSPLQHEVTRCGGTEPPFHNKYWNNKEPGIYVDLFSKEPLFCSLDKFDSGTGWPSFTRPLRAENITEQEDSSHSMRRVEVRSSRGDAHLGHLFLDGPTPTGLRYCINSAALRFIPLEKMRKEGFGNLIALFEKDAESTRELHALFAAGCFWGVEEILGSLEGVAKTVVGYTGGTTLDPTYKSVSTGTTGHAEAVRLLFNPLVLPFEVLLDYFFRLHDPTTLNRQGNDRGTQYRSAIFTYTEKQRVEAEAAKKRFEAFWKAPLTTLIEPAPPFYPAESEHQGYLKKHPEGYHCHYLREK